MKLAAAGLIVLSIPALAIANWEDLLPNTPAAQEQAALPTARQVERAQLPVPDQESDRQTLTLVRADHQEVNGDRVSFRGKAVVLYRGYTMSAEHVVGDRRTQVFTLSQEARLEGEDITVVAKSITIDYAARTYSFSDGDAVIPPSKLKGNTTGNIYLRSASGRGDSKREDLGPSIFTTCDKVAPHYSLDSHDSTILLERYAVMRNVKFRLLGKTIFTLPYFYVPLSQEESRLTPDFGQTEEEGYYAKFRYYTPVKQDSIMITRLDLMSKLGQGLGNELRYNTRAAQGAFSVYGLLAATRTLSVNANHNQGVGKGTLSLDGTYQRNNYLTAPDSVILSTRAQLSQPTGKGNLRVGFQRGASESAGFVSSNQNVSLAHQMSWGRGFQTNLDLNFAGSETRTSGLSTSKSERLDLRLTAQQQAPAFDAQVDYQRAVPVGTVQNFFSGSDRTPQFTLQTNLGRLTGNRLPAERLGLKLDVGELRDSASSPVTRINLEATSRYALRSGRFGLSGGGRFVQGLYSDDTAQYVLNYDDRLSYEYRAGSTVGINYSRLGQFGFTPLAIDQTGRSDSFSLDWQHHSSRFLRFGLSTGYDVFQSSRGNTPWQSIGLSANYDRGLTSRYSGTLLYDTFSQVWSSLRLDGAFRLAGADWTAGARYDGFRSTWAGANLQVKGHTWGKLSTDAYFGYNGYTRQMEVQQFRFVYDLHCMEALLQVNDTQVGFRPGRTVGFYIRVKALPQTNNFGFGSRGQQYFGTGGAGY